MTQTTIFDAIAARRLADEGLAVAGRDKNVLLERAKQIARRIALSRFDRTVTMDDVHAAMQAEGIDGSMLGNAAGSTFKGGDWQFVDHVRCKLASGHGRFNKVWRYIGK